MAQNLILVSHKLCPYVQRAAIVLREKQISFERRNVDLAEKPDWFKQASPLGKTPVLLINGEAIFESVVICEYLDETCLPQLHPDNPLERAKHRSYMEFGSSILNNIASFYNAESEEALQKRAEEIRGQFAHIEGVLGEGPFFMGNHFSMVDAVFGPIFRYFPVLEQIDDFGFFDQMPKVNAWRKQLENRASVQQAISPQYHLWLRDFFIERKSALSKRIVSKAEN